MKQYLIIGGALVVVLGAIAGFPSMKKSTENQYPTQDEDAVYVSEEGKTLDDLISRKLGKNVYCRLDQEMPLGGSLTVETYLAGDKLRLDYTMTKEISGQKDLHIISDGNYSYLWGKSFFGEKLRGMKIPVSSDAPGGKKQSREDILEQYSVIDTETPLNCKKWKVDSKKFSLPEGIIFDDVETAQGLFMGQVEEGSEAGVGSLPGMGQDPCSMCEQLPSSAVAECKANLNCSS